jgi:serine phosphatase RsbU (regulator of sigma subunit)
MVYSLGMIEFRDFYHLPELNPLLEQISKDDEPGIVIVAGVNARPALKNRGGLFSYSGRTIIFDILLQNMMKAHPYKQAIYVTQDRASARPPRELRHRIQLGLVDSPEMYNGQLENAVRRRPGLLAIDRLDMTSAQVAFAAAKDGLCVLAQFDTVLWGSEVFAHLLDLGVLKEQQSCLKWVVSVQRMPALCPECKVLVTPAVHQFELFKHRFPHFSHLISSESFRFYQPGTCPRCQNTGRSSDIAVFDIYHPRGGEAIQERDSLLPMDEYMFRLVMSGHLALDDLLSYEKNLLRRTYTLLNTSEAAPTETNTNLGRKLAELEAANQVLLKRTEVMISLQDTAQLLTTSTHLDDLATRVCSKASDLCGANRAILYYLRSTVTAEPKAEVLAVAGWNKTLIHQQFEAKLILDARLGTKPVQVTSLPVEWLPPELKKDASELQACLTVPLVAQQQRVGLMIVHSTQKKFFSPGDIALLQTFANQAALAIQREGLIDELQGKITQLEAAQVELVKKERLEGELELARQVQQSFLPRVFPDLPGFAFAAKYKPARQVGGDFYDVIALDVDQQGKAQRFGIVIADVSDKGMPSALYMALTRSLLLAESQRATSPRLVLLNVNRLLLELGQSGIFVSVFYAIIDPNSRQMTYARAGHDRPIRLRQGQGQFLGGSGAVLGILADSDLRLTEEQIDLQPGDRFVLYTDGLTDATNPEGDFFGLNRLKEFLQRHPPASPVELCTAVFTEIDAHQGNVDQFDDMTLLVMEVKQTDSHQS